jgi:hypothetical protein
MDQKVDHKQDMGHQTSPEDDRISQQVDPVVFPRENLPL